MGSYINAEKQPHGSGIQMKGKGPRNKEGLPSPESNLKVSWSDKVWKEVI